MYSKSLSTVSVTNVCQLCSKVLLIRRAHDRTGAEVLNILDYQMADVLT